MEELWYEFRASPAAFLVKYRTNVESLITELLEILCSDEKSESIKLSVLGTLQDCSSFLFDDLSRVEFALNSLKNSFENQRNTADHLVLSQILVTMTVMLVGTDFIESLQQFLVDFVTLLLDIVEKVKTEPNKLLRAVSCECLKELELAIPGLLCDVVGFLYGLTIAENSFIHQHYMAVYSTALMHNIQKLSYLFSDESSPLPDDNRSLEDLLFHSGKLTAFEPPLKYLKTAQVITSSPLGKHFIPSDKDHSMLKKAVAHLVDHCHLFTSNFKVHMILQSLLLHKLLCKKLQIIITLTNKASKMMKIVRFSSLAPVMLKSLLLRYMSSSDLQLLNIVLLMKLEFDKDICDEKDEDMLNKRLLIAAVHPCLETHWTALALQWFTQFENCSWISYTANMPAKEESGKPKNYSPLLLQVFDTQDVCWHKLQALLHFQGSDLTLDNAYLKGYLAALQKPVLYGIVGAPAQLLYRTMVMCATNCDAREDVQKTAVDVLMAHPQLTEHTVDMLEAVENSTEDRSITQTVLSQMCQWLLSLDVSSILSNLLHHLILLESAAQSLLIKHQIPLRILQRIIYESDLCDKGVWVFGNALLKVCNTLMQTKPDASLSKSLVNLLVEIAKNYNEIDVRDRAKFYSQVLLCVSSEKLHLLLSDNEGKNSDLSQVVVARISDNVYPLPSPVKVIESPVLVLNRDKHNPKCMMGDILFVPENQDKVLEDYRMWLMRNEDNIGLKLSCSIAVCSSKPDWIGEKLYAVVLQFITKGKWNKPKDIQIGSLSTTGQEISRSLALYPLKPYPSVFDISSIFTLENSNTVTSPLLSLKISFQDFFHVLPVDTKKVSLSDFFDELWKEIESLQYSSSHDESEKEGALSVSRLEINKEKMLNLLSQELEQFCVDSKETSENCKLLIFLPPHYHVLLKLSVQDDSTVFEIATDLWNLLPFIGEWISSLLH